MQLEQADSFLVSFAGAGLKWPVSPTGVILDNGAAAGSDVIVIPAFPTWPGDGEIYPVEDTPIIGVPELGSGFF